MGTIGGINPLGPIDTTGGNLDTPPAITIGKIGNVVVTAFANNALSGVPTVTAPEILAGYTGVETEAAAVASPGAGSFTSSLALAGGTEMAYVSVSFDANPGSAPPAQTTIVQANPQGTVTHSTGALTLNEPVFGTGGGDIKVGTKTGNTEQMQCASGSAGATGDPLQYDASGNAVAGVVGQFVPAGGTAGQVLTKNSSTDYDDSWITPATDTHSESLTDGNSNFIFAIGDIVTVVGVPN